MNKLNLNPYYSTKRQCKQVQIYCRS